MADIPMRKHAGLKHTNMLYYPDLMHVLDSMVLSERALEPKTHERGHYETEYETETVCGGGMASACTNLSQAYTGKTHQVWVPDETTPDWEEVKADAERVRKAKAWFMNIYETSSWYGARHCAGLRLSEHGIKLPLADKLEEWVEILCQRLCTIDRNDFWAVDRVREDLRGLYGATELYKEERVKKLRERIATVLTFPLHEVVEE